MSIKKRKSNIKNLPHYDDHDRVILECYTQLLAQGYFSKSDVLKKCKLPKSSISWDHVHAAIEKKMKRKIIPLYEVIQEARARGQREIQDRNLR